LERAPGREAYPGDIFYLHAQLMERGAKLSPKKGSGSRSLLSIVDTLQGDIAGFIPTNTISMTDGQIFLNSALFAEGFKPAIDVGLSVSRIGTKVQPPLLRELTKDVGLAYIQYRELLKATRLRAGVSEELNARLRHGEKIERIFMQAKNHPSSIAEQIILFYALRKGALDDISNDMCEDFKMNILKFAQKNYPKLMLKLERAAEWTAQDRIELNECIVGFFKK
jgi:F-type H+-transporting ATPase subunit alpha